MIVVSGSGFATNTEVGIFLIPESQVSLRLDRVRTDGSGAFETEVRLPNRPSEQPQTIRVVSQDAAGVLRWTQTARDTLRYIIETVFLALIATTFATVLAIPLSFFAARNLMQEISSPLTNVALGLIAVPVGVSHRSGGRDLCRTVRGPHRRSAGSSAPRPGGSDRTWRMVAPAN